MVNKFGLRLGFSLGLGYHLPMENSVSILSAIILAMARLLVAPGEGAFLQWRTRLASGPDPSPRSKTKSSTRLPCRSIAWARTPAGPRWMSYSVMSGMYFCNALTCRLMNHDLDISLSPKPTYLLAILTKPGYRRASNSSKRLMSPHLTSGEMVNGV